MHFPKIFLVKVISALASSVVFFGCSSSSEKVTTNTDSLYLVEAGKSYEFKTGFSRSTGQVFEDDGKEFVAFADYMTTKKIQIFDLSDQSLFCSVPLDSIIESGQMIAGHTIVNKDSILVLCEYTNQLMLINANGEILKQVDLNKYLNQDTVYALYSHRPILTPDGTIYSGVMLDYYTNLARGFFKTPEEKIVLEKQTPYLVAISGFFSDSITVHHGLRNFYSRFVRPEGTILERPHIELFSDKLFMYSIFCDTIYEINANGLFIENSYPIHSDYSALGYETVTYKESLSGKHNELFKIKGHISKLIYDETNDLYFVTCVHERTVESAEKDDTYPWPGSYIIYDNNFNKLNEVKMDDQFFSGIAANTKAGFLCTTAEKHKEDKDFFVKINYELYKLHKN